jgi:hypothetical protein
MNDDPGGSVVDVTWIGSLLWPLIGLMGLETVAARVAVTALDSRGAAAVRPLRLVWYLKDWRASELNNDIQGEQVPT